MKRILAGFIVILFAGTVCASLTTYFGAPGQTKIPQGVYKHPPYYASF